MDASDDFRRASLDVWERMAANWDRERGWLWESSRATGEWMVEAIDPQPSQTVLELAAGTGETGFAAAPALGENGKLISTDFAPAMVKAAREGAERLGLGNVECRVLDAEKMDLEDDSVDAVLCRWGYMLMADPAQALEETRRVLRDGGRLAFSVFAEPERNPWAAVPAAVIREQTDAPAPDPNAPGILAMGDKGRTESLLDGAGFDVGRWEDVEFFWRFDDFETYWRFLNELAGALASMIEQLGESEQDELRGRIEAAVASYETGDGYEIPAVCHNIAAG